MNIPYGELMKYRGSIEIKPIYDYPVFQHEYAIIQSMIMRNTNILDFGCGTGKVYNEALLPNGYSGLYVGIDNDPTLKTRVNFPLYDSVDEIIENYGLREFDMIFMLNALEHMKVEESYEILTKLNPYIDANILIMTPNSKCFDYMFVDPQHTTFYSHEFLYGLLKHLGFDGIQIWRGKGIYPQREAEFKNNNGLIHFKEMNEFQRKVCLSMSLDWYGNLLVIGERNYEEDSSN